ncbi:MAG TPA: chorismate mutase [Planctomycetota bacterium]|jgi:chorismate mutase|nr:chorismate mutase [Planctomycetota bacterium]
MPDQDLNAELAMLRAEVDRHNATIASVLKERAAVVLQIAAVKRALRRPALDEEREEETLTILRNSKPEPLTTDDLVVIFRAILDVSRRLQERV